jgi:ABC-type nitrate/sulfonate/bicarbonate transport system permease component
VGLAYLVFATAMSFDVALSFASVIVLSLIGVFLFKTVCYIEKKYNGKFEINR